MEFMKFDADKCSLCGICVEKCPFGALTIEGAGIVVSESCRMCGLCVRNCPEKAIQFEQKAKAFNKDDWKNFLIYVEQERGEIHPVTYELVGEARKMAGKVGYEVNCVIVGGEGTKENAEKLLPYGVDHVYVYEDPGFEGFRADCYADAVADCIAANKPSSVLIGATALGRSLAPRLSTRFHTGLTADCTTLDIKPNTDMIQVRPAFGGNIMAQIGITKSRPQFATVRYKVMDKAEVVANPHGEVVVCPVNDKMAESRIKILSSEVIDKVKSLEEEDVLVVAGSGVRNEKNVPGTGRGAWRSAGIYPSDGRKRIWRYGASDRSVRSYRASEADHHLWRIRSDPVYVLYERIGMYRSDQHGSAGTDLRCGGLLYRR